MKTKVSNWLLHGAFLAYLAVMPGVGAADAYLDAITNEANAPSPVKDVNKKDYEELVKLLTAKMPATHKIFVKLTDTHKNKVISLYSSNKELSAVSKEIFDLYLIENK